MVEVEVEIRPCVVEAVLRFVVVVAVGVCAVVVGALVVVAAVRVCVVVVVVVVVAFVVVAVVVAPSLATATDTSAFSPALIWLWWCKVLLSSAAVLQSAVQRP